MTKIEKIIILVRATITAVVLSILLVISYLIIATFNTQIESCTKASQLESKGGLK